ncbi:hypothetical protein [Mogibacterium diversum]|uniref:hypothetical protein n=1 Tax=Mogibacterium diversum TaxID=114527 RepID=UPI002055CCAE|nr:hypothetical protein [Mogibacterium diversum]DAO20979.1 MAG TPA: hypothetical protein [Caudoviricetes sp.]
MFKEFCDLCESEIVDKRKVVTIEDYLGERKTYSLCEKCQVALQVTLEEVLKKKEK